MKSIFNQTDNNEIINRIQKLKADNNAGWGKMSVSQMVLHAQMPIKVAFEEVKLKRRLVGILFGGMAKKKLVEPGPFSKNLPTDKNFIISGNPDFEKERINLINYVKRLVKEGPASITKEPHPFFGKLTTDEWDKLIYKHLDHHLRQFNS